MVRNALIYDLHCHFDKLYYEILLHLLVSFLLFFPREVVDFMSLPLFSRAYLYKRKHLAQSTYIGATLQYVSKL